MRNSDAKEMARLILRDALVETKTNFEMLVKDDDDMEAVVFHINKWFDKLISVLDYRRGKDNGKML